MDTNKSVQNDAPASGSIITEKMYGISILWIFKSTIIIIFISLIALFFNVWFPYLIIAIPFVLVANPLIRLNFHYFIEDNNLKVKQGVISKKDYILPYGVIQNVIVKQDIFDRIFGLATLNIQNAVGGNNPLTRIQAQNDGQPSLGVSQNSVNFIGLKKMDAEVLKTIILRKMEENRINDRASGL